MMGDDDGVLALAVTPAFAINQRAAFVGSREGSILWETLSVVTDEAIAEINRRGGALAIAVSHPHFYSSMVEWSRALGDIPILVHSEDRQWPARGSSRLEFWSGTHLSVSSDLTLVHCPGHFPGSTVLHWRSGANGAGALLAGDSIQVAMDLQSVSVMHSYPNAVPVPAAAIHVIRQRLEPYKFENIYGYSWGRNIIGNGKQALDRSLERYLSIVGRPRLDT